MPLSFSRKFLLIGVGLLLCFPLSSISQAWQTITSSTSYSNRDEHGYVELFGKFYLIGGAYQGLPKVQEYDPATNTWTDKGNVPIGFHHIQPVAYDSLIWVMASWEGSYASENDVSHVWTYNPLTDTWTQGMMIPASRRRGSAGVVVQDDKFYILGGNSGGHGPQGDVKDWVDVFDPHANNGAGQWDTLSPMPIGRDHFQAVGDTGKIYAIGGRDSGTSGNFFANTRAQVDIYDIASDTWTTLPATANLPITRAGSCNLRMDHEIIVMLGVGENSTDEKVSALAFNTIAQTWRNLPDAPHSRSGTQAVPFGRDIYVASGINSLFGGASLNEQDKLFAPVPVVGPPELTGPDDVSAADGQSATFSVYASSITAVTYQWQRLTAQGWSNIPGADQTDLVLPAVSQADDSTYFRVEATNSLGTTISDSALLTIRCGDVYFGDVEPIVMEVEHYYRYQSGNIQDWSHSTTPNAEGSSLAALPNQGTNLNTGYQTNSPELEYDIDFVHTGTYYVWMRIYAPSFEDNSVHAGLDGVGLASADKITYDTYNQWGWTNKTMDGPVTTIPVNSTGTHTLNLWMREDGVIVDRILLTRDASYTPTGAGPPESDFCYNSIPFPVEWTYAEAIPETDKVSIQWGTSQEYNNAYFEVQRRLNRFEWITIDEVEAHTYSSEPQAYQAYDKAPEQGKNYYRIKQVDFDGKFAFSSIMEVTFEAAPVQLVTVAPNPVNGHNVTVSFDGHGKGAHISILDLQGKMVQQVFVTGNQAGTTEANVDVSSLAKGIYFFHVGNEGFAEVKKVVVN